MDSQTRRALIAAAVILGGFAIAAYFMPAIMLVLGDISPWVAALVPIVFVGAFFLIFWLRGRSQARKRDGSAP